jgi:hypothetical protein
MTPQPPRFSWLIFGTLWVILGASLTMFYLLVRRWTTQRQWVSLAEWARQRQFRFKSTAASELPTALESLREHDVKIRLHVGNDDVFAMQLSTSPPEGRIEPNVWNVLVRRCPAPCAAPAALRPANAPASALDLLGLSQFPAHAIGHRFTVLSTSHSTARTLAEGAGRTLMPPDIGLLRAQGWIVLDFSTRPFDPIELDRMIALATQLSSMV